MTAGRRAPREPLALHVRILIGLVSGLVIGIALNETGDRILAFAGDDGFLRGSIDFLIGLNGFVGDLFLRSLRFVAVPIVLFSLIVGASSLRDLRKLGRIGGKTVGIYLATTALSITVGLLLANLAQPGSFVSEDVRNRLAAEREVEAETSIAVAEGKIATGWDRLLDIVPRNPAEALADGNMLQIVFLALVIGIALTLIPDEKARPVMRVCEGMTEVILALVRVVMQVAPFAVFTLLVEVMASMGLDVLGALLVYSAVVVLGLGIMVFLVYPTILRMGSGIPRRKFLAGIAPAQLLAFSSSSSSATLPVTMECVEDRLGVSGEVTSFVIPLGATINMDAALWHPADHGGSVDDCSDRDPGLDRNGGCSGSGYRHADHRSGFFGVLSRSHGLGGGDYLRRRSTSGYVPDDLQRDGRCHGGGRCGRQRRGRSVVSYLTDGRRFRKIRRVGPVAWQNPGRLPSELFRYPSAR